MKGYIAKTPTVLSFVKLPVNFFKTIGWKIKLTVKKPKNKNLSILVMNKDIILKCWISYFNPTVYLLYELSAKNSFKKLLGTNGPALQPPPPSQPQPSSTKAAIPSKFVTPKIYTEKEAEIAQW